MPQFNETSAYPKFLSCGLLHVKGKNGANVDFCLPKVYPFPPKSLYIEHEKDGRNAHALAIQHTLDAIRSDLG
ncbi:hypothetical protein FNE36_00355 [Helicobacter pylori]|nr:hypothetical protein [Helicobacter pylori]MBM0609994.1 hypothetical protein [Helicobacter pylori]MBM0619171.1 hypothetical protein [Helicobacter pylori]MBM0626529.1 hypothetical protein [Helicobacter pylori]WRG12711.1 hypothetical protein FNE36_00355 [Helicobacter pylori]